MRRFAPIVLTLALMSACGPSAPAAAPTQVETAAPEPTITATAVQPIQRTPLPQPTSPSQSPDQMDAFPLPSSDGAPVPKGAYARLNIGSITVAAISLDGQFLSVGTTAGLYVYQARTLMQVWKHLVRGPVSRLYWSPNGTRIAAQITNEPGVQVFDAAGGQLARFEHSGAISDFAWSPDSTQLAVAWSEDETSVAVTLWDVATLNQIRTLKPAPETRILYHSKIARLIWLPDGQTIVGAIVIDTGESYGENAMVMWDALDGRQLAVSSLQFGLNQGILQYLDPSPDGRWIAGYTGLSESDAPAGQTQVFIWDSHTAALKQSLALGQEAAYSVGWSPDSTQLAGGSGTIGGIQGYVSLYDIHTGALLRDPIGLVGRVSGIAWSPDGATIIAGSDAGGDGGIHGWDSRTGRQEFALAGWPMGVRQVMWLPDGSAFLSVSPDRIQEFDAATHQLLHSLVGSFGYGGGLALSWSPDGNRIAARVGEGDHTSAVVIWDAKSLSPLDTLPATGYQLAWSQDGKILVTNASPPGESPVYGYWDPATGRPLTTPSPKPDFAQLYTGAPQQSPDGRLIFKPIPLPFQGEPVNSVTILNAVDQQPVEVLGGFPAALQSMAWSPDGRYVAGAGGIIPGNGSPWVEGWDENVVIVWDTTSWQPVGKFLGHTGSVRSLAWSPDSQRLASGSADGTVIIWNIAP